MDEDTQYALGKAVKYYRQKAGISQRKLAKAVQISNAMLSLLESGKRESISATTLHKIHERLGVDCEAMMRKAKEFGKNNGGNNNNLYV